MYRWGGVSILDIAGTPMLISRHYLVGYSGVTMVTDRAGTVLNILVTQYIHTASPVASEDIARLSPTRVSPATIRNAMSELTEEGYISRPHISAGGIPSDRGYRYYVESLAALPELPLGVRRQIKENLSQVKPDVVAWTQRCAEILSHITANVAIVTAPRGSVLRLKHLQLVYLQDYLALLILVLQEGHLLRRFLHLEEPVSQDHLTQVANKFNEFCSDLNYAEIEGLELEATPLEDRVTLDTVGLLHEAEAAAFLEHYMDGLRLLINQPEFSEGSRARELVEMIEEKVLLESVLAEAPESDNITIYIGQENQREALRPFSIILHRYGIPQAATGTICVVGPTRMFYPEAMSGVSYLSSLMSEMVSELHSR